MMRWVAGIWLVVCVGLAVWLVLALDRPGVLWLGGVYGGWTVAMSVVSLGFYGWDKRQARLGGWRVSEKRLHVLELLGGWPGAALGQAWFRHKSYKRSYRVVFSLILLVHAAMLGCVGYLLWRGGWDW